MSRELPAGSGLLIAAAAALAFWAGVAIAIAIL